MIFLKRIMIDLSEPDPNAGDYLNIIGLLSLFSGKVSSLTVFLRPVDANIGCKLPPHLVSQPQTQFHVRETGTYSNLFVIFTVEINLDFR